MKLIIGGVVLAILIIIITIIVVKVGLEVLRKHTGWGWWSDTWVGLTLIKVIPLSAELGLGRW